MDYKKIKDYLNKNTEELTDVIEQIDELNGFLGDDRIYSMDDIDEMTSAFSTSDILAMTFHGYDLLKPFDTDDDHRMQFNPHAQYFYFNGYGNLVSCKTKDYSILVDDCLVDELVGCFDRIDISGNLLDLITED